LEARNSGPENCASAVRPRDLDNPRQDFLRNSVGGLFLHWGLRSAPAHTSCTAWEKDVTSGGWTPDYWVNEAKKLHTQYLVLATFHSRLGYARPWPSKIPGSCSTERDFLGELITAAKAKGMKVILYMTDDPKWHDEGGHEWLDSAAYSAYKGKNVDLTTRDGFSAPLNRERSMPVKTCVASVARMSIACDVFAGQPGRSAARKSDA